jgi:heterotetrameric sarcosine oxidase gamma subunit
MGERVSALAGDYRVGRHGLPGEVGVALQDRGGLVMHQVAAWPDTIVEVGAIVAGAAGADSAPGPRQASVGSTGTLLRIEPLKWWIIGTTAPTVDPEIGNTLDVSHSRTQVRVSGPQSVQFLNRHMSLDLREASFQVGAVGSTVIHHVGVTLWRSEDGYELFLPRGFALSLWEGFVESAGQFGLEVVKAS